MKALVVLLLLVQVGWAQDIVLKANYSVPGSDLEYKQQLYRFDPIDINEDGIPEFPVATNNTLWRLLDPITMMLHPSQLPGNCDFDFLVGWTFGFSVMRHSGLAEVITSGTCAPSDMLHIVDAYSGDILFTAPWSTYFVFDYDQDGLDDLSIVRTSGPNSEVSVFGVDSGSPVSPPQDLDIQASGDDYIVSWVTVPTATAYRVLWSSSIDGVSYTRIGYTTETNFTHRNRASEPMGFYRVMSEDNGTGVVRMVGRSGSTSPAN